MERLKCDVLVVGGGPAGATAARDLSRQGIDTILLEKDNAFQKPCGGGLMLSAYEEFDIPESVITKRVNKIEIISPAKQRAVVDITEHPLTVVPRCVFDATLRERAVEAGVHLIEAKAYAIEVDESPIVWAKNAEARYEIEANYVIAADGVTSTIRKKLLNQTPSRVLTYYVDIENSQSESCQFWFGEDISPKHYSWIFPHHNGVNIGLACDDEKVIRDHFTKFRSKSGLQGEEKPRGYYIPTWDKEIYYEQKVFFVGDSASMVLPFTYEGIYYAMKSGRLAAEAIVEDDPQLYQQRWEKLYRKKFRFLKILQRLFLHNDYLSEKLVRLYQKPAFQHSVIGYWMGTKTPSGSLGTLWKFVKVLFR